MTIPTDIVLAFILLVMFNFLMNLYLFYKWHQTIEDYHELEQYYNKQYEWFKVRQHHNTRTNDLLD